MGNNANPNPNEHEDEHVPGEIPSTDPVEPNDTETDEIEAAGLDDSGRKGPRKSVRRMPVVEGGDDLPIVASEIDGFARRLYQELTRRSWSQTELAKRVWNDPREDSRGYTVWGGRDLISAYVKGKVKPSPATLKMIADAFGMTPEELAPDLTASAVEQDAASINIRVIAGHEDKALLRVNRLVSLKTAVAVAKLLEEDHAEK